MKRWKQVLGAVMVAASIGAVGCGRPADTVRVEPASAAEPSGSAAAAGSAAGAPARTLAPRMTIKDHRDREVTVPVAGQVTVLSFASRSTADRGSERARAIRVAHPEVAILEVMDLSSAPGFLAGKVKSKLAERHQKILADTQQAFTTAGRPVPADLEERIHIVPDWSAAAFKAYGATNADDEVQVAVIGRDGVVASFFDKTPTIGELDAAVVEAAAR